MKKNLIFLVFIVAFGTSASADALKNSLTHIMHTKKSPSLVDLGNINLNAKPIKKRKRSPKAVIAVVNGHKIIKKDADSYISLRTRGQIKDFDLLPKKQRIRLVKELSVPLLAADIAQKELTPLEKQTALTRMLVQKEAQKITIKDEEAKRIYEQMTQQKLPNHATQKVPPFEQVKERLKAQMIEKRVMAQLMKDVKIEVIE